MKIISIKFKNIHSLKGEHFIDFTTSPLSETGLFAITGPTGAGKSSILDAMTVALYGKVPRINNESSREVPTGIMTRGTTDCFAETVFQIEKKRYLSRWSARIPRKNIKHSMDLTDLSNDEILDSTLKGVPVKVEELSGLNYERFLRSVFLSQGEFASFLKAKESERGDLLEQITGTEIYSQISKAAHQRERLEKTKLDTLQEKQGFIELLSAEELEKIKATIELLNANIKQSETEQNSLQNQLQWLIQIEKLKTQLSENREKLLKLKETKESLKPIERQIQLHDKASRLAPELRQYEHLLESLDNLKMELAKLGENSLIMSKRKTVIEEIHHKSAIQLEEIKKLSATQEPLIQTVIRKDEKISEIVTQQTKLKQEFAESNVTFKEIESNWKNTETEKQSLNIKLKEVEQWLKENSFRIQLEQALPYFQIQLEKSAQLSGDLVANNNQLQTTKKQLNSLIRQLDVLNQNGSAQNINLKEKVDSLKTWEDSKKIKCGLVTLSDLEKQQIKATENIEIYKELVRLSRDFFTKASQGSQLKTELSQLAKNLSESQTELNLKNKTLETASQNLKNLSEICTLQARIATLEEDRKKLESGKPCPLCGATEHPFVKGNYKPELSENEQKRDTAVLLEKNLIQQISTLRENISRLETLQKTKAETELKLEQELKVLETEFSQLAKLKDKITSTPDLTGKLNNFLTSKQETSRQIEDIRKIDEAISELKVELEKLKEAAHQRELQQNKLSGELKNIQSKIAELLSMNKDITQKFELENVELNKLLKQFNLERPAPDQNVNFLQKIRNSITEYHNCDQNCDQQKEKLNKLEINLTKLIEQKNSMQKSTDKLEQEYNTVSQELEKLKQERFELYGKKDTALELENLKRNLKSAEESATINMTNLNDISQQLAALNSVLEQKSKDFQTQSLKFNSMSEELLKSSQALGFEQIEGLKNSILNEDELTILKLKLSSCEDAIKQLQGAAQSISGNLEIEEKKKLTVKSKLELDTEIQSRLTELNGKRDERAALSAKLTQNEERKKQMGSLLTETEAVKKEWSKWQELSQLIGSADGTKLSRFAQGLTLANLVALANKHLRNLNKRYKIRKAKEKDLELEIMDMYQADAVRPMRSLSGGETFIVSLALALGLSDLAGNKTRIESLFIDEGFGSLDADTLDTALNALENLQASGKLIGIISHVELLKERISTQIIVEKMSGGVSRIAISD